MHDDDTTSQRVRGGEGDGPTGVWWYLNGVRVYARVCTASTRDRGQCRNSVGQPQPSITAARFFLLDRELDRPHGIMSQQATNAHSLTRAKHAPRKKMGRLR